MALGEDWRSDSFDRGEIELQFRWTDRVCKDDIRNITRKRNRTVRIEAWHVVLLSQTRVLVVMKRLFPWKLFRLVSMCPMNHRNQQKKIKEVIREQ